MGVTTEPIVGGGAPVATARQVEAYYAAAPGREVPGEELAEIVAALWEYGGRVGIRPDIAAAHIALETGVLSFTGDVEPWQHNPAGIGTTGGGVKGSTFPDWRAGIAAYFVHLLTWCNRDDLAFLIATSPSSLDPRVPLVQQARQTKGPATTWGSLAGRWAIPGDNYAAGIERHYAGILALPDAPQQAGGPSMTLVSPLIDSSHPSPNRGYNNRFTRRVDAIVDHITDGTDSLGWLTSPASNASANYLIRRDGRIFELVPPTEDAWANGTVDHPNIANPHIARWLAEGCNFNQRTVSIEHECKRAERITTLQLEATTQLQAWLCQRFGLGAGDIFGHNEIDSVNRPFCPGFTVAEWDAIRGGVAARLKPSPAPFQHAPGFIGPPLVDNFSWGGDSAGIITKRITEVYNDQTQKHYRLTWTPEGQTVEEI